jgi:hypothetical protein
MGSFPRVSLVLSCHVAREDKTHLSIQRSITPDNLRDGKPTPTNPLIP